MRLCMKIIVAAVVLLQGCAAVNTFPTVARAGDTVTVMVGGTEKARKDTIAVTLTDANNQIWDLQALGLVRSVFNLRADGRAEGAHYSSFLKSYISWSEGHEAVQTVLAVDLPAGAAVGVASLTVNTMVDDDSSAVASPYAINVEIIPGSGGSEDFLRQDVVAGDTAVDFAALEPAPHAKISFGITDGVIIGAASLVIDFDETIVAPGDINLYVPESSVRGSYVTTGSHGKTQRMVYWRQDGQQLFIDVIAPQGINQAYLKMYVIHPRGLTGNPNLSLVSSNVYDVDGNAITLLPDFEYFQ